MANMCRGPPRKACQVAGLEHTVGGQGGWLPNFSEASRRQKLARKRLGKSYKLGKAKRPQPQNLKERHKARDDAH